MKIAKTQFSSSNLEGFQTWRLSARQPLHSKTGISDNNFRIACSRIFLILIKIPKKKFVIFFLTSLKFHGIVDSLVSLKKHLFGVLIIAHMIKFFQFHSTKIWMELLFFRTTTGKSREWIDCPMRNSDEMTIEKTHSTLNYQCSVWVQCQKIGMSWPNQNIPLIWGKLDHVMGFCNHKKLKG